MELETLSRCNVCSSENIKTINPINCFCQCQSCGYIFDSPRPTTKEIANFYSTPSQYDSWLVKEKARDLLWARRLKLIKKDRQQGKLLDVGTGIGQFLNLAKADFEVYGTEISKSGIEIAKDKYNLDIFCGEIENIDFKNHKFDVITLFHVLEHVPNVTETLAIARKLLNENGIIVIAVPNDIVNYKMFIINLLRNRSFSWDPGISVLPKINLENPGNEIHLSHFKDSVLKRLLEQEGFHILQNTLDPYYAATGFKKFLEDVSFKFWSLIKKITRRNFYDCIFISAELSNKNQAAKANL